jgi:glycosyltransferase involved in cell wall biosynthesis
MIKTKIAFIGSRGIPPKYGGAETFVYEISERLKKYFDLYISCESDHFGLDELDGIKRVHIWAKHTPTITIPVIYDIIATLYLLRKVRDVKILYYVAPDGAIAAVLARFARRKTIVNTDGIEWKRLLIRMKFAPLYLKPLYVLATSALFISEFLACKVPDVTIADSITIKKYLERRWRPKKVEYIAYGVRRLPEINEERQLEVLKRFRLERHGYYLTIGRIVAENNIHVEIEAFKKVKPESKLVIVGPIDPRDPYVKHLLRVMRRDSKVMFIGGIYDLETLYALRANCRAYIHPYTVGGTNPSLLEQLQFDRPIIAYDTPFHREILGEKGFYFTTVNELIKILEAIELEVNTINYSENLVIFSWNFIVKKYNRIFKTILDKFSIS